MCVCLCEFLSLVVWALCLSVWSECGSICVLSRYVSLYLSLYGCLLLSICSYGCRYVGNCVPVQVCLSLCVCVWGCVIVVHDLVATLSIFDKKHWMSITYNIHPPPTHTHKSQTYTQKQHYNQTGITTTLRYRQTQTHTVPHTDTHLLRHRHKSTQGKNNICHYCISAQFYPRTPFFYKNYITQTWASWFLKNCQKWTWNILKWFLLIYC